MRFVRGRTTLVYAAAVLGRFAGWVAVLLPGLPVTAASLSGPDEASVLGLGGERVAGQPKSSRRGVAGAARFGGSGGGPGGGAGGGADLMGASDRLGVSARATFARLVLAGLSGVVLYAGFAPRSWWWAAVPAFALLGLVLRGRGWRAGLSLGYAAGLGFFVPLLSWTGEYVGAVPWLALAAVQALFVAAAGAGIAVVARLPGWPVWAAAVWVAGEEARSRVPFDGFPWGVVAFGQDEGPFLPLAALGGTALVGFAVVVTGFLVAELIAVGGRRPARVRRRLAVGLVALVPLIAGVVAGPLVAAGRVDAVVTVAVVQGNVPRLGLDFNGQRRAVLDNHVARTEQLAADVEAGRMAQPDLVVWPENAADVDPLRDPHARALVDRAARRIGAPILVGAVLRPAVGQPTNTMVVWDPVRGPGEVHDKRRLQPFGEYVPYRFFFRKLSGLVDRASNFRPGGGDGAVDLGPARVGVATCYEVIFDDLVRQSVRSGAQLLAVPSNNATFGLTDMTYQQLAISRVRAVEHGRAVVVPSTSGVSAVIGPDGTVTARTGQFVAAAIIAEVPLRSGRTPATVLGGPVELALTLLGLAAAVAAVVAGAGRGRRRSAGAR